MASRALTVFRGARHLLRNDSKCLVRQSKRNAGGGPAFNEEGYTAFWGSYVAYYNKCVLAVFFAVPMGLFVGIESEHVDEAAWTQDYQVYPYTHCRWKKLPNGAGNKTLFHNDTVNPVPGEGYVAEYDPHHGNFLS